MEERGKESDGRRGGGGGKERGEREGERGRKREREREYSMYALQTTASIRHQHTVFTDQHAYTCTTVHTPYMYMYHCAQVNQILDTVPYR